MNVKVGETVAGRMARFAQRHREDLATYIAAGIGVEKVSILGADNAGPGYEPCPACIALNGTVWPIEKCPPLPYSECTQPLGCRCVALAVVPP